MMTKKVLNAVLPVMLSCALMLNSTGAYAQGILADPAAANDDLVEYSESEAANDAENGSEDAEELSISEADFAFNATAAVTNMGSLTVFNGVKGTDFEYDEAKDIITIKTDTHLTITDRYNIYSDPHKTSLIIDSPKGANLTLNTVHIYAYVGELTEENVADGSAAGFPAGRAGIEITGKTGDVIINVQNEGAHEDYLNCIYGGKDRAGIEKNEDHKGKLIIQGPGRLHVNGGWSDPETKQGAAAIGSTNGHSTSNITLNAGRIGCSTTSDYTKYYGGFTNNYGATIGAGTGGTANNIVIAGGYVSGESSFGAAIGAGHGSKGKSSIKITGGEVHATAWPPAKFRGDIYKDESNEPAGAPSFGIHYDDIKNGASCDITIEDGDIQAVSYFGSAFSCGNTGTFTFNGGSVYCDAGYDTDPDTKTGKNSYGVHADKVIIDAPYDVERILQLESTHSYAIYANDIEMNNGVVANFGSYWRKTTSTHYAVVVKNSFNMTGGFFQTNGGLLVENNGNISVEGGIVLSRIQGQWENADTSIGVDTTKTSDVSASISFGGNSQIYSFGGVNAGNGPLSISDKAFVRTITGTGVGVSSNNNTLPAYSAGTIDITGGKTIGYVSTQFSDKDFSDIEDFKTTSIEAKTLTSLANTGTDEIQYEKRRQDAEDDDIAPQFTATAAKQVVFATPPSISSAYNHQVRAAVNSTNLAVVNEEDDKWNEYTYVIIDPYVNIQFKEDTEKSIKLTPEEPTVQFKVETTPKDVRVRFESSDPERISIDPETGVATAHHAGKANITASPVVNYAGNTAILEFTVEKGDADASISLDDWYYGQEPSEIVLTSSTHNIEEAEISYAKKDGTPLNECPTEMGEYIVKATFPDNDDYNGTTVQDNFSIDLTKVEITTTDETELRLVKEQNPFEMQVIVKGNGDFKPDNSDSGIVDAAITSKSTVDDTTTYILTLTPREEGKATLTLKAPSNNTSAYRDADEVTIDIIVMKDYIYVTAPTQVIGPMVYYDMEKHTGVVIQKETLDAVVISGDIEAVNAGTYTATFSLKSGYAWATSLPYPYRDDKTIKWTIYSHTIVPNLSGGAISITYGEASYVYTGKPIEPPVTVLHNGVPLEKGVDYDVTYSNNINASNTNPAITVTGKGNYTGKTSSSFNITDISLRDCTLIGDYTLLYNGSVQKPTFVVQNPYGVDLVQGENFAVIYNYGVPQNVGSYTATLSGRTNYKNILDVRVQIVPANIEDLVVSGLSAKQYANGEALTQDIVLKNAAGEIIPEADYTITYDNNKEPGIAKMYITPSGNGNLTGSQTCTFSILRSLDFDVIEAPTGKTLTYNGTLQTGVEENEAYTITGHQETLPGVYYARVTPNDGYAWNKAGDISTINVQWEISKVELSKAEISEISDQVYTGSEITPSPVIKLGDFEIPKECYTVTYADNIETGTAAVNIEARQNNVNTYIQGSETIHFNIIPAEGSITAPLAASLAYASDKLTQNSVTIDIVYPGDGKLTAWISNPLIAVVSGLKKMESGHYELTLAPRGRGYALLHLAASGGKNYTDANELLYINVDEVSEDRIIVDIPQGTDHVYNGSPQLGVAAVPEYITLVGTTVATEVGEYTVTATPNQGYAWNAEGDTAPKTITWRITKLPTFIEADTEDVILDIGDGDTKTASFQLSHHGVGELTLSSSDNTVADVQLTQKEIKAEQTTYTLDVTARQVGTTFITIQDDGSDDTYAAEKISFYVSVVNTSKANVVPVVPIPKTGLVYNGSKQIGVAAGIGYMLEGPSVSEDGASVGVNAGDYWVIAKVESGYVWSDTGDTEPRNIHWTIAPASLEDAAIEGIKDKTIGKSIYQDDMVVRIGNVVIPESEYTVVYDDKPETGVCNITITGRDKRNVTGTAAASFRILEPKEETFFGIRESAPWNLSRSGFVLDSRPVTAVPDSGADAAETRQRESVPGEILVVYEKKTMPIALIANEQKAETFDIPIVSAEIIAEDIGEDSIDIAVIEVADASQTEDLINQLNKQDGIYAQPNYIYHKVETPNIGTLSGTNDPQSALQYYLEAYSDDGVSSGAGVYEAWNTVKTEGSVTVAVLDTGCEVNHPDLQANIDIEHMWDAYNESHVMSDPGEHGTHVCGIVGAVAGNDIGIAGASYNANILPIKVFDNTGENAYTSDIVKAYQYLAALIDAGELNDLHVVNMSLGGYGFPEEEADFAMEQAIADLRENYQVLTVAAGGNGRNGMPMTSYFIPSDLDCVFSVTSLDQNGDDSFWSDYNQYKDISAPGDNIYSTVGSDGYVAFSGTSMASPLVSGIAALMFAAVPGVHPDDVVDAIRSTAHSMVGKPNHRGNATGSAGAIDAVAAIEKLVAEYGNTEYFLYNCDIDITGINEAGGQYYTGSAIIPEIKITAPDGTVLVQAPNTESQQGDYVVTFRNNVNAGTAYMKITGINRCSGTRSVPFRIYYNLEEHGFIGAIPAQAYDENEIMPIPQVSYDSSILTPGQDYVIRYEDNNAVGTDKIYIDGINDYLGSLSGTFKIIDDYGQVQTPKAVSGLHYNGRVQTGVPASANGHYTITGNTATDAGTYIATAKIADGFVWDDGTTQDKQISYSIDHAEAMLSVERTSISLKDDTNSVSVRIIYSGDNMQSLTVISEDEQVATARIDGNMLTVQGVSPGITRLTLSAPQGQNYNAVESTIVVEVQGETEYAVESTPSGVTLEYNGQLQSGILATDGYEFTPITEGCSLDEIGNAVARDAGVYQVGVKKIVNYPWQNEASPKEEIVTFEVLPAQGERVNIIDIAPVTYTGSPIQPSVEALFKGAKLAEGSDYTLTYSDNVNAGIATAKLVFNGNYTGSAAKEFEITKAAAVLNIEPRSFAFDLNQGKQADTAVITYTGDGALNAISDNESVAAVSVEGHTLEVYAGSAKGEAVITVSASGETNYLSVEPVTVTVKVTGEEPPSDEGKFKVDSTGNATVTFKNNGADEMTIILISAAYDEQGKLVSVKYVSETIGAGETKPLETGALDNIGAEIRAFLWNGDYSPLENAAIPE